MCECCGGDCRLCAEQMKQPLNEAYNNELLESYQKLSANLTEITLLMASREPYESWPKRLHFPAINPDLMGSAKPGEQICVEFSPPPQQIPVPEYCVATGSQIAESALNRIKDMGRVEQQLITILDDDLFCKSAFDPFWTSQNPEFDLRLDELRVKVACLSDNLWAIVMLLRGNHEE